MKYRNKIFMFIFLVSIMMCVLQNATFLYPYLKYFDEIYAVSFIPMFLFCYCFCKNELKSILRNKLILCFAFSTILYVVVGLIGNLVYRYQTIPYILMDGLANLKFLLSVGTTLLILVNLEQESAKKIAVNCLRIVAIMLVFFVLIDYTFGIFNENVSYRYGLKVINLFFSHTTIFSAVLNFTAIMLILMGNKKIDYIFSALCFLTSLTSLRSKTFGFFIVAMCVIWFFNYKKLPKKLNVTMLAVGAVVSIPAMFLIFKNFDFYFISNQDESARYMLTKTSVEILKDCFPIGFGFGTFASHASSVNYSVVYKKYGIDKTFGLMEGNAFFVSDTFWPMVIGQTGFLGTLFFALSIFFVVLIILQIKDSKLKMSGILAVLYLLISSLAEASFVHSIGLGYFIIIGICIANWQKQVKDGANYE